MDNSLDDMMTAILDGKYSWACVLWLRARGYNPKEYMPCRTYNRLVKENYHLERSNQSSGQQTSREYPKIQPIVDLSYLDDGHNPKGSIRGGSWTARLSSKLCSSQWNKPNLSPW
ncbi:HetP family heterocyst commitment protein [Leptothoe sp. PORK10 BA2]|uniref:HetP family heterocyst commitment protein n=1 Tax=Leptothoe sp. PORK10 BA2 TaxID=3110254 RepID=UPI002B20BFEA|nr:HetP family heterocyst commitment protein [Leptothoe sp. PORK10 BA2]MEA5466587.1 HetP family heterocyst commitment protein [Leptothoe sp. PORK10 BA2]